MEQNWEIDGEQNEEYEIGDESSAKSGPLKAIIIAAAVLLVAAPMVWFLAFRQEKGVSDRVQKDADVDKQSDQAAAGEISGNIYDYAAPSADDCGWFKTSQGVRKCLDEAAAAAAVKNNNPAGCSEVENDLLRDNCVLMVAKAVGNPDFCGQISNTALENLCVSAIALAKKDAGICALIGDSDMSVCQAGVEAFLIANDGDKKSLYKCRELKFDGPVADCLLDSYINKFNGDCSLLPGDYRQDCIDKFSGEDQTEDENLE